MTEARTFVQTMAVRRNPSTQGTVLIRVEYDLIADLRALTLRMPARPALVEAAGFAATDRGVFEWDGATDDPWLTVEFEADRVNDRGYDFIDRGDWSIIHSPSFSASWEYVGSTVELEKAVTVEGEGVASSDGSVIYLGPYAEHRASAAGQRFRLVEPEAASLRESPDDVLDALTEAAAFLEVGGRNEEVVAVAAPTSVEWGWGGLEGGENGFWVRDSSPLHTVHNTWVHEYVHTRQAWATHPSTEWLVEGTAEYYAALCPLVHGRLSFDAFRRHVATDEDADSVLVDPDRWSSRTAHYTKGRRVTAALDAELRRATDKRTTLQDLWRRANEVDEEPLTHDRLLAILSDLAGRSVVDWLDEHVSSPATPAVPESNEVFRAPGAAPGGSGPPAGPEPESVPEPGDGAGPATEDPPESPPEEGPGPEPEEPTTPEPPGAEEPESEEPEPEEPEREEPEPEEPAEREPEPPGGEPSDDGAEREPGECPVCGGDNDETASYCQHCGTALYTTCPVCGRETRDQPYCPECGTQLADECGVCGYRRHPSEEYCPLCGTEF